MTDTVDVPPSSPPPPSSSTVPIEIERELQTSYLSYAMSVIVSRALPDARDGLKPVHRRILFGMEEAGNDWNRAYRKSARIVGDVMGKYHPHGDQAIYEAMVRMAQDFSMRLPLIDGQGNFGSMDGDPPAAMRYTEVRLAEAARALLDDIDKDTVDFQSNYDNTTREPIVLPARIPNLLVNGGSGIAVGMATNIPTHNLGELIDAIVAYLDNPDITIAELMTKIPAPDFPTGALIMGQSGAREAFETGRGTVVMRSKVNIEDMGRDRQAIIVTEIPFQVNKSRMVEQIAEVARDKRVDGIAEIRDESDRDGVRVVIEVKRDANIDVVLNQLYRYTSLQTNFSVNMLALNRGKPELLNLKQLMEIFVDFREEVITRRTKFELTKARERAQVLLGLAIAVANIDEVVALVRKAKDPQAARDALMARAWPAKDIEALVALVDEPGHTIVDGKYRLSDGQARAILDLRLQRLTALGRDEIDTELHGLAAKIHEHLNVLRSREKLYAVMRKEFAEVKEKFATPRRSEIVGAAVETDEEDLIQREEMVVTVSHAGYIKRVPLSAYRVQARGGRGRTGMATRDEDFVSQVFIVDTHTPILFFSTNGKVYRLKTYMLPLAAPQARGRPMINMLPLAEGETIATMTPYSPDAASREGLFLMFATAKGNVRRNAIDDFERITFSGKIAMKLDEGDRIVAVAPCLENQDVLLSARGGKCVRFAVTDVRVFKSRSSDGVRGMRLKDDDEVMSMSVISHIELAMGERESFLKYAARLRRDEEDGDVDVGPTIAPERAAELAEQEEFILAVTAKGFGKRTSAFDYRITNRGGSGIINIEVTPKNGAVVGAFPVENGDQIMLITDGGRLIRTRVSDIRIAGRNTQGVTLVKTDDDERVVSVAWLAEASAKADAATGPELDGKAEPGETDLPPAEPTNGER
ncbi:MAG: DNA gyrase subunit A [Alphaproteobacteria bacterium]|nr:DNA gyrase subunit A [Alphaproteobacteria bacterium]